ncbi:hypothetical protein PHYSODRAFT_463855, partial [Phytophthora sojae]
MRLTFIFGVVVAATLHASGPRSVKAPDVALGNGASPATADGGWVLRRVEKNNDGIDQKRV